MVGIPKITFKGISLTMRLILKWQHHSGRRLSLYEHIVLDDKVVPVGNPYGSIRTHFGVNWPEPFISTGEQVPTVFFHKTSTLRLYNSVVCQPDRWLTDKGNAVPVFLRIIPGRIELDTRCRGKASHHVHLTQVRCHGMRIIVAVDFLYRLDLKRRSLSFGRFWKRPL